MRRPLLFALLVGCSDVSNPFADPRELVLEVPADMDPMCLDTPLDDVLDAPGVQVDCEVEDVLGNAVTSWVPCENGDLGINCYLFRVNSSSCSAADHLELIVIRRDDPAPDTLTRARCVVE